MADRQRIDFAQVCDLDAYTRALARLEQGLTQGCNEIVLDFSYVERAYPDCLVPLIATLARVRETHDLSVSIRHPRKRDLRGVFDGVGWTQYLERPDSEFSLPESTPKFTPIRPFRDGDELEALHRSLMNVLVSQARLATNLPEALEWDLWEGMDNVLSHAAVRMGWVQAASFPMTKHVNIVVDDAGIGIRESLAQAYP